MNSINGILANRYAKAFLNLSSDYSPEGEREAGILMDEFSRLRGILKKYDKYLLHPAICASVKTEIFEKIVKDKTRSARFLEILIEEGRYVLADLIIKEGRDMIDSYSRTVRGVLETKEELSESEKNNVEKVLGSIISKKAILSQKLSDDIIGGFRARLGDFFIDASLKGGIEKLKKELLN